MNGTSLHRLAAEFFSTFGRVFANTGANINGVTDGGISHIGVGLTFGLILLMIYAFGHVSGVHVNPAVPWRRPSSPEPGRIN